MKKEKSSKNDSKIEKSIRDLNRNFPETAKLLLEYLGLAHLIQSGYSDHK